MEGLGQKRLGVGLTLLLLVGPLIVFVLLSLGFPPVIGNLMAARAMKEYAAQVHPEWRAQGHWAGYDLVGGGYYLSFSDGGEKRSLGYGGLVVEDKEREEALRKKLYIDSVIRRTGLWVPDQNITMWSARWSPQMPDEAVISVDVQFYGGVDEPIPDEAVMRERMADQAMLAYEVLAAHCPIHRFSVRYHHRGTEGKQGGMLWNRMTVDLPPGETVTRDHILTGELATN